MQNEQRASRLAPYYRARPDTRSSKAKAWAFAKPSNVQRPDGEAFKVWLPADRPVLHGAKDSSSDSSNKIAINIAAPVPASWTSEELDTLIEFADRYDYRWPVIADRWPHAVERDVVELRAVFYSVAVMAPTFAFDSENERTRRYQLDAQFNMTRESEDREMELVDKLRRLSEERSQHAGISGAAVSRLDMTLSGPDEEGHAVLRSSRLVMQSHPTAGLGVRLNEKVVEMLRLLEVPIQPMPTTNVCDAFDALRRDLVKLFTLRKEVKKLKKIVEKKPGGSVIHHDRKNVVSMAANKVSSINSDVPAAAAVRSGSTGAELKRKSSAAATDIPKKLKT